MYMNSTPNTIHIIEFKAVNPSSVYTNPKIPDINKKIPAA